MKFDIPAIALTTPESVNEVMYCTGTMWGRDSRWKAKGQLDLHSHLGYAENAYPLHIRLLYIFMDSLFYEFVNVVSNHEGLNGMIPNPPHWS